MSASGTATADPLYEFRVSELDDAVIRTVSFCGTESISRPFRYEVAFLADTLLDIQVLLGRTASLRWHEDRILHALWIEDADKAKGDSGRDSGRVKELLGIVESIDIENRIPDGAYVYRAVFVHPLARLGDDCQYRTFVDQSIPEVIELLMNEIELQADTHYEFAMRQRPAAVRFQKSEDVDCDRFGCARWAFLCQYGESSLDFLHRLLAREGMRYSVNANAEGRLVFANDNAFHGKAADTVVAFAPDHRPDEERPVFSAFHGGRRRTGAAAARRDYNYRKPDDMPSASKVVDTAAQGRDAPFGSGLESTEEASWLADLAAKRQACMASLCDAVAWAPRLSAGSAFRLSGAGHSQFDDDYLVTDMLHRGRQPGFGYSGIPEKPSVSAEGPVYESRLRVLPLATPYQMEDPADWPSAGGVEAAVVDADDLDEAGRYRVRFAFDLEEREQGHASGPLRRALPYGGADRGWHYPAQQGQEVLVAFAEGDPERPYIVAAAPNRVSPSPTDDVHHGVERIATGSTYEYSTHHLGVPGETSSKDWVVPSPATTAPALEEETKPWGDAMTISPRLVCQFVPESAEVFDEKRGESHAADSLEIRAGRVRAYTKGKVSRTVSGGHKEFLKDDESVTVQGDSFEEAITAPDLARLVKGDWTESWTGDNNIQQKNGDVAFTQESGNTDVTVHGNTTVTVKGSVTETYEADLTETAYAAAFEPVWGNLALKMTKSDTYKSSRAMVFGCTLGGKATISVIKGQRKVYLGGFISANVLGAPVSAKACGTEFVLANAEFGLAECKTVLAKVEGVLLDLNSSSAKKKSRTLFMGGNALESKGTTKMKLSLIATAVGGTLLAAMVGTASAAMACVEDFEPF